MAIASAKGDASGDARSVSYSPTAPAPDSAVSIAALKGETSAFVLAGLFVAARGQLVRHHRHVSSLSSGASNASEERHAVARALL